MSQLHKESDDTFQHAKFGAGKALIVLNIFTDINKCICVSLTECCQNI